MIILAPSFLHHQRQYGWATYELKENFFNRILWYFFVVFFGESKLLMLLKGQCHEIFDFAEIFAAQGAPPVSLTLVANGKTLKGQCHEIFTFWFFSWISFPKHLSIPLRAISKFFRKFTEIFAAQGAPPVSTTPVANGKKIFKQKNVNNFVWALLGSRVNIYINFCLQVHFKVSAAWYCCHYMPPVSTTQAKLVANFAAGVVDTGCALWLANISMNFRKHLKWP